VRLTNARIIIIIIIKSPYQIWLNPFTWDFWTNNNNNNNNNNCV